MSKFFIVKTIAGDYVTGLYNSRFQLAPNFISYKNLLIPLNNISILKTNIPYNEYRATCKELGITDSKYYMDSMFDYWDCNKQE